MMPKIDSFSSIFDKSSIHGLPYVTSKEHGYIGRLAWLTSVLVSFSLAGLVIWSNVNNWLSQPSVVTSVEYSPVEVIT